MYSCSGVARTHTGRLFFVDHNTKVTTWEDPRQAGVKLQKKEKSKAGAETVLSLATEVPPARTRCCSNPEMMDKFGPLPPHWEERLYKGRVLFINHQEKTTQYEDPRLVAEKSSRRKPQGKLAAPRYSRDYKRKLEYFRSRLRSKPGRCAIKVNRTLLYSTAYEQVRCLISFLAEKVCEPPWRERK